MFEVNGYDKDNDLFDILYRCDDFEEAQKVGLSYKKLCDKDRLLSTRREPYDWIEIFTDEGDCIPLTNDTK